MGAPAKRRMGDEAVGRRTRRAKECGFIAGILAPVLSRAVRAALPRIGTNRARSSALFSGGGLPGSRLKTGAEKPKVRQYVGRAEFFALLRFAARPFA